jgi:hypothetical protein
MTRRGSLIYYLTAWICGCFFMSLFIWVKDLWGPILVHSRVREAFGLMFFYFYGLVLGALPALLAAFLLRRVMALLKCKTPSHWAVVGAILAPSLMAILGAWGRHLAASERPGFRLLGLLTFGPKTVVEAGWWLAIPAGAATAYLLCRVQRAFAPVESAPVQPPQPTA